MDLNRVNQFLRPPSLDALPDWQEGFAWLAGGTWLFSEPQPSIRTLIDLESFAWPPLQFGWEGLEIAATCKIAELDNSCPPSEWIAAPLIRQCCRSLLASFKIWNEATVGGNICLSLPAGAMISLTSALEGICTIWNKEAESRKVAVIDFVTGNNSNLLAQGELLRQISIPASALQKEFAFRRFSLTHLGRSSVLLIGTLCPVTHTVRLTVTAATVRPIQLVFESVPQAAELKNSIDHSVRPDLYFEDAHGSPDHRQHLTYYFAEQIRVELANRLHTLIKS
jgi:CO/xanthine dehydrogenase FAD-binding subunit